VQEKNGKGTKGIRTIAEVLRAEDFPADKHDLAYSIGDLEVQDSKGHSIPVRVILDYIEQSEFKSAEEAVRAIRGAVEKASKKVA